MPGQHRAEVTEIVWPDVRLAQINFGDGNCAPLPGLGDWFAGSIEDC
jgi:hypothetical protein